jgi:Fic family protein
MIQSTTHDIVRIVSSISEKLGRLKPFTMNSVPPELRMKRRAETVYASLKLEGPALSYEKIDALMHHMVIHGPAIRLREASNLLNAYDSLHKANPWSQDSFRRVHDEIAQGIDEAAGQYRNTDTGIFRGTEPIRLAPPPGEVEPRMTELFDYLNDGQDLLLIKGCLCHYFVESIRPFETASGIMGRLWQTLILMKESPVFECLSIDQKLYQQKKAYFRALSESNSDSDPYKFLYFMLGVIGESLFEFMKYAPRTMCASQRILSFHEMGMSSFTRKDYMGIFREISPATASRDLEKGVNAGLFKKTGTKNSTKYACRTP